MALRLLHVALLAALTGLPAEARGQGLVLSGGDVDLQIPVTGGGFGTAVDESTRLDWTPHERDKLKVTVESVVGPPTFALTVEAVGVVQGQGVGPVTLTAGMLPQDLVFNIKKAKKNKRGPGWATLRFEASMPPGPPASGTDIHTVIYTLTAQ